MSNLNNTVFVDVDTQFDFMNPEGGLYVPGAETIEGNLAQLIDYAAENAIPIIASADAHTPDDPEFKVFPPQCVKGTHGQERIDATLRPAAKVIENRPVDLDLDKINSVVLEKVVFDMFDNPNTEKVLAYYGAHDYVVFGVATDYCVRAAALGLRKRGYDVTVVSDAVKAVTAEGETNTLKEFAAAGIRLRTTAEITGG
jgi:nicotinamidase/pyrazinamidase